MERTDLKDLAAFIAVAQERSFTIAAAKLGLSQSALSRIIQQMEERLGVRLLARTTRSVGVTEAGRKLLNIAQPALNDIASGFDQIRELRERPSGTLRIVLSKHAADAVMMPALTRFLPDYPEISVELVLDERPVDIVATGYDAGVRLHKDIDLDMIAVRISPDIQVAIVAAPAYFARRQIPASPHDLLEHNCINYRVELTGGIYPWEFIEQGRPLSIRVPGNLLVTTSDLGVDAALRGLGIAYTYDHHVRDHIAQGRLVRVLGDWCPPFPGFYLFYPGHRQTSAALAALVGTLRSMTKAGDR